MSNRSCARGGQRKKTPYHNGDRHSHSSGTPDLALTKAVIPHTARLSTGKLHAPRRARRRNTMTPRWTRTMRTWEGFNRQRTRHSQCCHLDEANVRSQERKIRRCAPHRGRCAPTKPRSLQTPSPRLNNFAGPRTPPPQQRAGLWKQGCATALCHLRHETLSRLQRRLHGGQFLCYLSDLSPLSPKHVRRASMKCRHRESSRISRA